MPLEAPSAAAFWARWLLLAALFCWPALLLGHAAFFWDTTGYYKHGHAAVSIVERRLARSEGAPAGMVQTARAQAAAASPLITETPQVSSDDVEDASDRAHQVRGARSIIYSIMTYVLAWPGLSMLALTVVQALAAGFVTVLMLDRIGVTSPFPFAAVALVAGLGTTAPWFASFALPDIFAATGIAGLALLLTGAGSLRRESRIALLLLTALSLALHASHLLAAVAMLGMAGVASVRTWLHSGRQLRTIALASGALLAGLLMVAISGYAAFGELSIAPKRYPLTLARVIENGPGRWYLARACPQLHYEICKVMPDPPSTAAEIVFGEHGLKTIATSEQLDRIRDEEIPIVLRASAAYPRETLDDSLGGSIQQLGQFGLIDLMVDQRLREQAPGVVTLVPDDPQAVGLRDTMQGVTNAVTWLAIALLPFSLWLCRPERRLILLIIGGIAANAAICATLSAVADRYQGRVMWLVPVIICALIARTLRQQVPRQALPTDPLIGVRPSGEIGTALE